MITKTGVRMPGWREFIPGNKTSIGMPCDVQLVGRLSDRIWATCIDTPGIECAFLLRACNNRARIVELIYNGHMWQPVVFIEPLTLADKDRIDLAIAKWGYR